LDGGGFAFAFDDGGVFFVHHDALGTAEIFEGEAFKLLPWIYCFILQSWLNLSLYMLRASRKPNDLW
jgi:hypothetical protein